ncbi:Thymidylate synthase [Clonorchis sinensis]|uniref:Thymidylate synthase n=1 Tax=Clonorchis sinensis TaxID=79923 RepID=A0A3R7JUZ0_CLOSI|nr:Thymidylate synthase [Clonorchis sinensis]
MDQDAVTNGDKQETESPATLPPTIPYFPDHIYGEAAYLNLLRHILCHGVERSDRTGTGTLAVFGPQMRFSLRDDSFPLLTTKQVFFRGIVEELLWFIRGSTDSNELAARKVHFWDANGSREFLDNLGFTERKEGDLGPVYGFQWRHSGADYIDCDTDYTGQGVDQLAEVIRLIRERPWDRRILIVAWNVRDLKLMALPPCHCLVQFFVANGELSCQLYQRSGDMGLGIPFNIASYSLLTYMIAHLTGLKPGEFVHTIGDSHVYLNHREALSEQVKRVPRPPPKLKIVRQVSDINDFKFEDFQLLDYSPYPKLKMKMAV